MGKQLPIGLFVIVFIVAVLFVCNYQWDNVDIPLSRIFSEDSGEFSETEHAHIKKDAGDTSKTDSTGIKEIRQSRFSKKSENLQSDIVTSDFSRVPFTIQVASYKDKKKAKAAFDRIKANDYPVYLIEKSLDEKGVWYRIYIGEFNTRDEADEYLLNIRGDFKDGFIISP
jgi:hypothetical protein